MFTSFQCSLPSICSLSYRLSSLVCVCDRRGVGAVCQFADYGKDRQAAVMYHLEQLRMLLLPTQVTKMCMWSLHQPDEFYDEERNQQSWGGGIWNILCRELHVRVRPPLPPLSLSPGAGCL